MRFFVGDVQGCLAELEALLEKANFDEHRDELFFVGDLVNRGPESAAVVRFVRDLDARSVLGNHERGLLRAGLADETVAKPNKFQTCEDLLHAPDRIELGSWLRALPPILDLDDLLLVHAAVPPSLWKADRFVQPKESELDFVLYARHCDANGNPPDSEWPPPGPPFEPWHHFYEGSWMVVFGHWARKGLQIGERFRGLDTGCVYGRQLTGWIAEEDRLVHVDARRAYYPKS